ncbi:MAG: YfhO family protein [Patescibacteria group bacterium]
MRGRPFVLAAVIILAALVILFWDFLTLKRVFIYTDAGKDVWLQLWPNLEYFSGLVRAGHFPLWSHSVGLGSNIFSGALYGGSPFDPFNLLLFLFRPDSLVYLLSYVIVLKIFLAGIFFYLYLKNYIRISGFAALVGALAYVFSGPMIIRSGWYYYGTEMAFFPLLLMAYEVFLQRKKRLYLSLAFLWLAGYSPFLVFAYFLLLIVYSIYRFGATQHLILREFCAFHLRLLFYCTLGVGGGFIIFLPNLVTLLSSLRFAESSILLDFRFFIGFQEFYTQFLRFFSNDALGGINNYRGWSNYFEGPGLYIGVLPLLLLSQLLTAANRKKILPFLPLFVFVLLYLFVPLFRSATIGFSADYYKLNSFFVDFILIFAAVIVLDRILKTDVLNKRVLTMTFLFLSLIPILLYLLAPERSIINVRMLAAADIFLLIYLILLLLLHGEKKRMVRGLLLFAFVTELIFFSFGVVNFRETLTPLTLKEKAGYNDYSNEAIDYIKNADPSFYRVDKDYKSVFCCNDSLIQAYKGTDFYQSLVQRSYVDFLRSLNMIDGSFAYRAFAGFGNRNLVRNLLGVKYFLSKLPTATYDGHELIGSFGDLYLYRNNNILPTGFVYDRFINSPTFKNLSDSQKDIALLGHFVSDAGETVCGLKKSGQGELNKFLTNFDFNRELKKARSNGVELYEQSPTRLRGRLSADIPGMMFLSLPYDKGWKVEIDGEKADVYKIDGGLMGFCLNRGEHEITLQYKQPYLLVGGVLSLASILIGVYLFARNK